MQKEIVTFGNYAGKPIEWIVLEQQESRKLLLSRFVLDAKKFLPDCIYTSWERSSVRKWLAEEFRQAAFTAEESARIQTTKHETASELASHTETATDDAIFLLSVKEMERYFPRPDDRIAPADAAACKESRDLRDFTALLPFYQGVRGCWWWLRDGGAEPNQRYIVWSDGTFCAEGHYVNYERGIRPALWIE